VKFQNFSLSLRTRWEMTSATVLSCMLVLSLLHRTKHKQQNVRYRDLPNAMSLPILTICWIHYNPQKVLHHPGERSKKTATTTTKRWEPMMMILQTLTYLVGLRAPPLVCRVGWVLELINNMKQTSRSCTVTTLARHRVMVVTAKRGNEEACGRPMIFVGLRAPPLSCVLCWVSWNWAEVGFGSSPGSTHFVTYLKSNSVI